MVPPGSDEDLMLRDKNVINFKEVMNKFTENLILERGGSNFLEDVLHLNSLMKLTTREKEVKHQRKAKQFTNNRLISGALRMGNSYPVYLGSKVN
jgi:hypothetical protein